MKNNSITFGDLSEDGILSNVCFIKQSDLEKCPHYILMPSHYRPDGSCKCNDPKEQAMMIKEWGYSKRDFAKVKP